MSQNTTDEFFKNLLGHPAGLFVLFFTEMWNDFLIMECVPYLFCFLTSSLARRLGMGIEDAMACMELYYVGLFHSRNGDSWRIVI
jgi:POT family proton-dependent oligopeptide transporter